MIARSPIERLVAFKKERGWKNLKLYSDTNGDYTRDYVHAEDADIPAYNVFTRKDGTIRHFWASELSGKTADPGQDSRGAPELMPLWNILDTTPEGRGTDWYPKLDYPALRRRHDRTLLWAALGLVVQQSAGQVVAHGRPRQISAYAALAGKVAVR